MIKIKKRIVMFLFTLAFVFSLYGNVMAADTSNYEKQGFKKTVIEDDLVLYSKITENETTSPITTLSWEYVSKSYSGRFYLVSSGETVAKYGFDATFSYNSVDQVWLEGHDSWSESVVSGWTIEDSSYYNRISDQYMYCEGSFALYHDGEYNNSTTARIYCDHLGNITVID